MDYFNDQTEWRDIPGYEGLYAVNNTGDIYSYYTNKILKPSISNAGYKQCILYKDHTQHIMCNHKAVAMAFIPRENESLVVNHIDENKFNCSVNNLEWVTRTQNNNYMGNRAAQATFSKTAKKLYIYDNDLNLIGEYLGINKYAKENNLSRGTLSTVINANKNKRTQFYSYKGLIYFDEPLAQSVVATDS